MKQGKKVVRDNAIQSTSMIYIGNFVYNWNGKLQYILTDEGRLVPDSTTFLAEYFMKDHLGNTRAVYAPAAPGVAQVEEYQHYYPFGMQLERLYHTSGVDVSNKQLYNGKELQTEYGWQWYDYGARFYDPVLARWHSLDPFASERLGWSPYNFCRNNPILNVDPTGALDDWYQNKETDEIQWFAREGEQGKTETIRGQEWTNLGSELLKFEGNKLTYFWQTKDENGKLNLNRESYNAVSGNPTESGGNLTFNYSKTSQNTEGGALPEGLYYTQKSKVQYYENISTLDKIAGTFGRGTFRGGTYSWGENRWWLKPQTANAENRDMYSFTIHGGEAWGSHGCIDLTHNLGTFTTTFLSVANSENVVLWVDYSKISTFTIKKGQWGW